MKTDKRYFYKAGQVHEYSESQITYQDDEGHSNVKYACERCGGTGILQHYSHVEGGICFKCNGARYFTKSLTLITKEEADAKLEKYLVKKAQREAKKRAVALEEALTKYEALTDMYIAYKDTFNRKDELKELGYRYDPTLQAWYGTEPSEGSILVPKDDFYYIDEDWYKIKTNYKVIQEAISRAKLEEVQEIEYFGELDCTFILDMKVDRVQYITSTKYPTNLVSLSNGNYSFKCFTNAYKVLEKLSEGEVIKLKFTVKSHEVYNGTKVTYIKNLKLA